MKTRKRFLFLPLLLLLMTLAVMPVSAGSPAKVPHNKLVTQNGGTYYYNKKGNIVRNCMVTYKKKTYYFDKNGQMYRNRAFYHKGHVYYARANGRIAKNTWIGQFYYNHNGYRTGKMLVTEAASSTSSGKYKNPKKVISMQNVRQRPQLPTGCESVALTMVLKYYGFSLSKTTIASRYLSRSGSNFVTKFWGSPFSSSGGGIYSPGLTTTANKYLKAQKSALKAYDLTGIRFSDLYRYVDANIPVIVWNSMYMYNPVGVYSYRANGKRWTFYRYEHCVVFCGYDKKKGKVLINDPLSGLVWRKASSFERIYNKMGKMAVVIQ